MIIKGTRRVNQEYRRLWPKFLIIMEPINIAMVKTYCDMPGSPCLSKNRSNVRSVSFSDFFAETDSSKNRFSQ